MMLYHIRHINPTMPIDTALEEGAALLNEYLAGFNDRVPVASVMRQLELAGMLTAVHVDNLKAETDMPTRIALAMPFAIGLFEMGRAFGRQEVTE